MTTAIYDCYQVNLHVKLSEEDSCLYNRIGPSYFNVKVLDEVKRASCPCPDATTTVAPTTTPAPSTTVDPNATTTVAPKVCEISDVVILGVEVDKCNKSDAVISLFVRLHCKEYVNVPTNLGSAEYPLFDSVTLMITTGGTGYEKELLTFCVNPLPAEVVANGVFEKCCTYEITRVPDRTFKDDGLVKPTEVADPLCRAEAKNPIGGNVLRVMFPLTKEVKCLMPDLGFGNALFNSTFNNLFKTKVRIVPVGLTKFVVPASLIVDKDACLASVELDLSQLLTTNTGFQGYEHRLGLCLDSSDSTNPLVVIIKEYQTATTNAGRAVASAKFMALLASAKKLNVMGLVKCSETVLYSFRVCYEPYKQFSVLCDCKPALTIPEADSEVDDFNNPVTFPNTYVVKADCEYSYEYVALVPVEETTSTTVPPTTVI